MCSRGFQFLVVSLLLSLTITKAASGAELELSELIAGREGVFAFEAKRVTIGTRLVGEDIVKPQLRVRRW